MLHAHKSYLYRLLVVLSQFPSQMVRHAEFLKTLKTKPMHVKRLAAHIVEDINDHFTDFRRRKDKWGIHDDDISNFDESGFPIGVTTGEQVIVPVDCTVVYQADPANRELVTTVETLNYGGKKVPSMIIFSGAYHLRKHFDNDMDGDILFARSASGYNNDKLGLVYLKHFNLFTESSTKGSYRMLIFDGHGSHVTQPFIDYCWEHRIRPFLLPAHNTHLLQPLDVGVFQSLKYNFKKVVRKEIFNGATEISKVYFFSFFQRFHDRTFKNPKIYQSAFRKTRLIPFDPSVVLEKMKEYQALQRLEPVVETPSSPLLSSSVGFTTPPLTPTNWNLYTTPLTMRSRKKGLEYVRSRTVSAIEGDIPITPSVLRVQDKVSQASERSMLAGALATNRVHDLTIAEAAQKERKEASGKVVQKYGEIYGHQARRDIFFG